MNLLIMVVNVRSDLYLLLCSLASFENIIRVWFFKWSSTYLLVVEWKLAVGWAEGWSAKWRDNLLSKDSEDWRAKNIRTSACSFLNYSSMLYVQIASPWRVKSVCFTGNWKKFMCASETERSNVWLISIDRWNEHNIRRQWLENKQVVWKYF